VRGYIGGGVGGCEWTLSSDSFSDLNTNCEVDGDILWLTSQVGFCFRVAYGTLYFLLWGEEDWIIWPRKNG